MALEVRDARPGERRLAADLVAAARLPLDGWERADVLLVAHLGDELVGTAALERHGGTAPAWLLRSVAVEEHHRGTGAGAALVREALHRVGDDPVALLTQTAQDWFPRFGFTAVRREDLPEALAASTELQGACPASAAALLRAPTQ